ncbi:MAG TPA: hypothetical protein VFQ07_07015 [Candidatus Polarisedimenticolia bacterium]|nr:hypothetical protein [Candidatus Polarisedimenticolia bacterium]
MTTTRTLVWFLFLLFVIGIAVSPARSAGSSPASRIDDFEDRDLVAASGHSWVPLADDQFGGATRMTIAPLRPGAFGSKAGMRIAATLGTGPNSVAGAWTPIVPGGRPADLSGLDGLRLSLRGHGDVLVGIRRGAGMGGVNFMSRVSATPEWQSVLVPFARLEAQGKQATPASWDPHDARYIGISSVPGAQGSFEVEVDDVAWAAPDPAAKPAWSPQDPPAFRNVAADDPAPLQRLAWRRLATDPDGDGKPGLPDARALFTAVDPRKPITWVRVDLRDAIPATWIGVNLILDTDGDPQDGGPWWGNNKAFKFDRLVTAWVFSATDHYEGMIGMAPPEQVAQGFVVSDDEVHLALDRPARRVYLGVPSGTFDGKTRAVAAVGSSFLFSDDLPDSGSVPLLPAAKAGE